MALTSNSAGRELISWQMALALSAGAWILAYALFRIGMAAHITLASDGAGAPPPPAYLPPLVLALSAFMAVGAARAVLRRPLRWEEFSDQKDPGPALGAALTLASGLFLAGALGLIAAMRAGVIAFGGAAAAAAPPVYAEPLLFIGVWLLPAGLLKLIDWLALKREQGR